MVEPIRIVAVVAGTPHELYPNYPQPRHVGMELKLIRLGLRKALASVDPREHQRQQKEGRLKPIEVARARTAEEQARVARADAEYEAGKRQRAPQGYWERFGQRKSAAEAYLAQRENARLAKRLQRERKRTEAVS